MADLEAIPGLGPGPAVDVVPGAAGPLRLGTALPAARPRGTVIVLPGRAEFIEKYAETVTDLGRLGFAVAVLEWRGQGLSGRDPLAPGRGYIADFAEYLDDLGRTLAHLDTVALPRPWLMLGHSMGAHVGLRWLREGGSGFVAAVMTAPMFGIRLGPVPEPAARFLGHLTVRLGGARLYPPGQREFRLDRLRFEGNPLTSCPVRYARLRAQLDARPELAVGGATWGWVAASLRSIARSRAPGYPEAIRTPLLLLAAGEERVICNRSIERLGGRLPNATLRTFAGARHDLLLERDAIRGELLATVAAFADRIAP